MNMLRATRVLIAMTALLEVTAAHAQTCMVAPTDRKVVSGRFGKLRPGGSGNFGSANTRPHVHDGLDFSTSAMSKPVYATTDGLITHAGDMKTAGTAVLIKRDNGDVVAYYHLGGIDPKIRIGMRVQAGQQVGVSGNTPSESMVKHLHLSYGSADQQAARAASFQGKADNRSNSPFRPDQLQYAFRRNGLGWRTDPAPYFCDTFPISDGHPEDVQTLGADTKAQHDILFNGAAAGEGVDSAQAMAAAADAARARAAGQSTEEGMKDGETHGMPPLPPIGEYDAMSANEMLKTEASKRFGNPAWDQEIRKLSLRGLMVEYLRTIAIVNYMQEAIDRKKERIETLLATYTVQKLKNTRTQVDAARNRAASTSKQSQIQ